MRDWAAFVELSPLDQMALVDGVAQGIVHANGYDTVDNTGEYYTIDVPDEVVDGYLPVCLVGHILHTLGFDLRNLPAGERITELQIDGVHWQTMMVLAAIQGAQDGTAGTWGGALGAGDYVRQMLIKAGQV